MIKRISKVLALLCIDALLCVTALFIALALRLESLALALNYNQPLATYGIVVLISLLVLITMRTHITVVRFTSWRYAQTLLWALTIAIVIVGFVNYLLGYFQLPRSVSVLYIFIATSLIYISRILLKICLIDSLFTVLFRQFLPVQDQRTNIIIYGAGEAGNQALQLLVWRKNYHIICFIDDDKDLKGRYMQALPIFHSDKLADIVSKYKVSEVLLAIPSLSVSKRQPIITKLNKLDLSVTILPTVAQLQTNTINFEDIRKIEIEDLLGRTAVEPNTDILQKCSSGKTILVTGGGGSIGFEICKQLLQYGIDTLIIIDNGEYNLYKAQQKLQRKFAKAKIITVLASVTDSHCLTKVFANYKIDCIYHCAAFKHVPLVEQNPFVGFHNNCYGSLLVALFAAKHNVANFVLISSDKAVRPTNLMGSSKRIAELIIQSLSQVKSLPDSTLIPQQFNDIDCSNTIFSGVRFGNVLNSSGSVIPLFRKQLLRGGPITVTDKRVTRYFMTLEEASQLVIQSTHLAQRGSLFLLDMGKPVNITQLAKDMIKLAGLQVKDETNPKGQIAIEYIGLRPGEKLIEELLIEANSKPTNINKISICQEPYIDFSEVATMLENILEYSKDIEQHKTSFIELISNKIIGYRKPSNSIL